MVFFYHLVASTEQKVPKWVYLSVTFLNLSAAKYNNNMVKKIKQKKIIIDNIFFLYKILFWFIFTDVVSPFLVLKICTFLI